MRSLSLVAAAPLAVTPVAQAQTAGRLLLLNSGNGAYQVGGVDIGGFYHESTSGTEPPGYDLPSNVELVDPAEIQSYR